MKINKKIITIFISICIFLSVGSVHSSAEGKKEMPIYSVKTEENDISLTFDINWAEKDELPSILNILDKYNVKGTFFIMGGWVNYTEQNTVLLKEINERGHEIGNHSYIHPNFTKISKDRIKDELEKTDRIIESSIGIKPNLFRFPSGACNEDTLKYVRSLGYECIHWNVDSVDWRQDGRDIEYKRVMKKVEPGSILLFHNNAKHTPYNLDRIISELKEKGYNFKKVGEMIIKNNYSIDGDGKQFQK
ncbi:MAG: polysaccharide deacetylase family protein [Clostridium sp.]